MDLFSLPTEMLTIVLKKLPFSTMLTIRRMNFHCSRILAKINPDSRIEVSYACCYMFGMLGMISNIECTFVDPVYGIKLFYIERETKNEYDEWKKIFSRIRCVDSLTFGGSAVGREMCAAFTDHCDISMLKEVSLPRHILCSEELTTSVLSRAKKLQSLEIFQRPIDDMQKRLANRRWQHLQIELWDSDQINNSFLTNVVANCDEFGTKESNITLLDVAELVKKVKEDKNRKRRYNLGQLKTHDMNTVENLHKLAETRGISITKQGEEKEKETRLVKVEDFKICFAWDPSSFILLKIETVI